ncbi:MULTISPECIES: biopolymer transporter ExbB [unclassified Rhodosalinus]|uniref:biopolymer transporter ExbB n=1 Tax=unclassified Rhodosalinus TaxID=2630183 RepID=UPI003526B46C
MHQPDLEAAPHFSQPVRQIVLMLVALGLTAFGAFVALPRVLPVFQANPWLNGFIFIVFVIGVFACFWQVFQLIASVRWIEAFAEGRPGAADTRAPQLLAPLGTLLRSRAKRMQISATSTRSILDSVATRIEEAREITRYIVNTLIFLGLLGTFYGLATTVPAVVDTIRGLAPQEGEEGVQVFNRLMTGLEAQLGGMGIAFASSLLGLTGSLVVGLLELFASHGQNRFYRELEEWLSSITRLGFASESEDQGETAAVVAVIDQMADQMEQLRQVFAQSDESRALVDEKLAQLADSVERMTERIEAMTPSTSALVRVAEGHERLAEVLENQDRAETGIDAESRMRLRSIDVQLLRLLEEMSAGRQESMAELRTDLAALTRAVGQIAAGNRAAALRPRSADAPREAKGGEG